MRADPSCEAEPLGASGVFGDRVDLARAFVGHLATSGAERGLIGPRELPRLWTRHLLNCAVLGELVRPGASVVDVGSGAGLPGLALAIARPDLRVVLVEPMERRTAWLTEVVAALGLDVEVRRGRAEELSGRLRGDVVTSRAVAPLDRLLRWSLPLVAPGGTVLAIKGRSAADELASVRPGLARRGVAEADVVVCGTAWLDGGTTVVRVVRSGAGAPRSDR